MAVIPRNQAEKTLSINAWLGVNESPDSDGGLRPGEAARMVNFAVTREGALIKRPGTRTVMGLASEYSVSVSPEAEVVRTDLNAPAWSVTAYPAVTVNDAGVLELLGEPVTVTAANLQSYTTYYCQLQGAVYRLGTVELEEPAEGVAVPGGKVILGERTSITITHPEFYNAIRVENGKLIAEDRASYASGQYVRWWGGSSTWLFESIWLIDISPNYGGIYQLTGRPVTVAGDNRYHWKFHHVAAVPTSGATPVQGIWSGRVAGQEVMVAACSGHLWSLTEQDGQWTKRDLGALPTPGRVTMFGFGDKLYILNGEEYYVWDGATISAVAGYRPLVAVSVPPSGGGEALERVNRLTGKRRVRFSPDGTAKTFTLPEKGFLTVDYARIVGGEDLAVASADPNAGTVTLTAAPAAGINTVEIGYTMPNTLREQVTRMRCAEVYNGATDSRVFLYGDGTNKAVYSDLDYDGVPTAEYFPDLNEVAVGDSNTPVTAMIRHYDRLLVFKLDSAYTVSYDAVTLPDGTVTAGFFVRPVNRDIGSVAYGQACMVVNQPRTLDAGGIYEWVATSSSGNITLDQRNARRVSHRVEQTLREMDLSAATAFYDKIGQFYYVAQGGRAVVQNTENGAWFTYAGFPAVCFIVYRDELFIGTDEGTIRHVSRNYFSDDGAPIAAVWESGAMDFGARSLTKVSSDIYVTLRPERNAQVKVTIRTNLRGDWGHDTLGAENEAAWQTASAGLMSFRTLSFARFSFGTNRLPRIRRLKLRVKKFAALRLVFETNTNWSAATILGADIRVRGLGAVR